MRLGVFSAEADARDAEHDGAIARVLEGEARAPRVLRTMPPGTEALIRERFDK